MYRKILVPLDGSQIAEKILPHVEELASRFEAKVLLLQVIEPVADLLTAGAFTPLQDQLESDKKQAESYLASVKTKLEQKQIEVEVRIILNSLPIEAISLTAEQENVDLIAISSHGRSGLARVFYGSVAAGILHRVDRPLLIIRSQH